MKTITQTLAILFVATFTISCSNNENDPDAYGNFEVDEITISSKTQGELLEFNIEEGQTLTAGKIVGYVDTINLHLKRAELRASSSSVEAQRKNIQAQIQLSKDDLARIEKDKKRIESMYAKKAATQKQLDDVNSAADIAQKRLDVLHTQFLSVEAQIESIDAKNQQLDHNLNDAIVSNPINGTVLTKLANQHELVVPGRALYTMANLEEIKLKAYITGAQLSSVIIGQEVQVFIDGPDKEFITYNGKIIWISDEAEFTPKNIQTREERIAQVYAVKILVVNDGKIKIGMPGEVRW